MSCRGARILMAGLVAVLALPALAQQLTEEQKKELFLKAREDIRPIPRPQGTPRPRPRPVPARRPIPRSTPRQIPPPASQDRERTVSPDKEDIIPLEKDREPPREKASREKEHSPPPKAESTPQASRPQSPPLRAPVVIEKSGLADERGYQPPAKRSARAGWFRRYRYLTPAVRRAIDRAPVRKGRWRYIIIHNSGTRNGNARIFGNYHKNVRKMSNGLAYHFVIGNGHGSGNGEIEIGSRWARQTKGGHEASDYLNEIAIGICLVGDFNRDKPTRTQLAALEELVDYLRSRVGKVKGRPVAVRGHKQINPKPTDCPGDHFDLRWLRRRFGR